MSTAHPIPAAAAGTHRVGIDLVSVGEVDGAVRAWGARYLDRVYTAAEQADCMAGGRLAPERLAARFAAKESTIKALRPGTGDAVPWTSIEVERCKSGAPVIALHRHAAALAAREGVSALAVSLSHDDQTAAAVVFATTERQEAGPCR